MAIDPQYRYANKAERANQDGYDDFKLKKPFRLHDFYKNISALYGLKCKDTPWLGRHSDLMTLTQT